MSRHRNVRAINYYEEYDEYYNNSYGQSVEEEFGVSPATEAQFTFDRNNRGNYSSDDIEEVKEEEEEEDSQNTTIGTINKDMNSIEKARLLSCVDELQNIVGDTVPESVLVDKSLKHNLNFEKALDDILNPSPAQTISQLPKTKLEEKTEIGSNFHKISTLNDYLPNNSQTNIDDTSVKSKLSPHNSNYKDPSNLQSLLLSQSPCKINSQNEYSNSNLLLDGKPEISNFLLVLTAKYTKPYNQVAFSVNKFEIKKHVIEYQAGYPDVFDFGIPSPDDIIILRRQRAIPFIHAVSHSNIQDMKNIQEPKKTIDMDCSKGKKDQKKETPKDITAEKVPTAINTKVPKPIDKDLLVKEFNKLRLNSKSLINLVIVGHVDAGKSTLMGHLLYNLGRVSQKNMHRYETDSKKLGKASFLYAWVLDETAEERSRGITMDIAQSRFETEKKIVNLLDAPGHRDFIPNMIAGASQADAALLVVDATNGEFEAGFDSGGQTREHTLLIRSLGVSQLGVVINKLDNVDYSQERYYEIKTKLSTFLKQAGYKEADITFIPCSGLKGGNLTTRSQEDKLISWYKGPCLIEVIDKFREFERPIEKPFRMGINDVYKGVVAGVCVSGKVEAGAICNGQKLIIMPSAEQVTIKVISIDDTNTNQAFAGDQVSLTLSGCDPANITPGSLLCDLHDPAPVTNKFEARIVIFSNLATPITKGLPVVLHFRSLSEQAIIKKLISQVNKSTGEVVKKRPRCLVRNNSAVIQIETSKPVSLELYQDYKDLGRFMIRSKDSTVAAGIVTKIL